MKHAIAETKNLRMFAGAMEAVIERPIGMPGLVLATGRTGDGKTTAAAFYGVQTRAYYLRAWPTWTPTSMLAALAEEVGVETRHQTAPMLRDIVRALAADPRRPIFIDEADYLTDKRVLLETLRSLHDVASSPIVLIGMANFRKAIIRRDDQLTNRVSQWIEFRPADLDDARVLVERCCEVQIADDLLEAMLKAVGGSMRGLTVGAGRIEAFARRKGLAKVRHADWGDRPFILGNPTRSVDHAHANAA